MSLPGNSYSTCYDRFQPHVLFHLISLSRSVKAAISPDTLVVLQVQGGEGTAEEKGALAKLGALLASLVDEPGLLVVSDVKNGGAGVTPTDWIFELAGGGLIPASGGKAPLSFFEPTGFVAYLQKCSFSIANPRGKDLDALQALDEEKPVRPQCCGVAHAKFLPAFGRLARSLPPDG